MKSTLFTFLASLLLLVGCDSGGQPLVMDPAANPPAADATQEAPPASEPAAVLPALGETMELDQGKVMVAGPEGWVRPPRDPKFLVRFEMTTGTPYPSLALQLPEEYADQPDVTKANAAEFARRLQGELQQELSAKGLTVPEVKPLVLERFAGAEYSRQATLKGRNVRLERLYLVTVAGGRKYTIELQALFGSEAKYRPHALAMANGLQIKSAESAQPESSKEK